jgi:predicted RNA binding protein YcfA (HicA-like mRNA interferase family)
MPTLILETRGIIARLEREGWRLIGGTKHAKFARPGERIIVPRHRRVSA